MIRLRTSLHESIQNGILVLFWRRRQGPVTQVPAQRGREAGVARSARDLSTLDLDPMGSRSHGSPGSSITALLALQPFLALRFGV